MDDVQIGDIVFECYRVDDEIIFIANPFVESYIAISVNPSYDNEHLTLDEALKILRVDCSYEVK